jgi:hypothetical protein
MGLGPKHQIQGADTVSDSVISCQMPDAQVPWHVSVCYTAGIMFAL